MVQLAFLVACVTGADDTRPSVRDSAGIQLVESAQPLWGDGPHLELSTTPVVVIGTQEGAPYQLSRVAGAARLSDSRIVIADGASTQLRFYDSTGRYLHSAGRSGQGPGEFRRLRELYLIPGDTIIAGSVSYLLIFTGNGSYIRNAEPQRSWLPMPRLAFASLAWFDSERAVVSSTDFSETRAPLGTRDTVPMTIAISDPDSVRSRLLGTFNQFETVRTDRGGGWNAPLQPWFSPILVIANSPSLFYLGYGNDYAIRVFASTGELRRIIRRQWIPRMVTSDDIERMVAHRVKGWGGSSQPMSAQWERYVRLEPVADTIPAFSQLLADDVGRLWVRDAAVMDLIATEYLGGMPQEGSRWSVFDQQGQWLGTVNMPKLFNPQQIGADFVLGVGQNDDGVETVVMYKLQQSK